MTNVISVDLIHVYAASSIDCTYPDTPGLFKVKLKPDLNYYYY